MLSQHSNDNTSSPSGKNWRGSWLLEQFNSRLEKVNGYKVSHHNQDLEGRSKNHPHVLFSQSFEIDGDNISFAFIN